MTAPATEYDAEVTRLARLLEELYDPAGILMWVSAGNKLLGGKRPCDAIRDRDTATIRRAADLLNAIADGVFL